MVTLYKAEAELFEDIRWLKYGEFTDIEVLEEGELVEMELSSAETKLLELLQQGTRAFHRIGVHNGQPAFAVVSSRSRIGYRYKRRYKF